MTVETSLRELIRQVVREELEAIRQVDAGDAWISIRRAAELVEVHPATIRRRIRAGRIEARGSGRLLRVRRADVERILGPGRREERGLDPAELARRDFGGGR